MKLTSGELVAGPNGFVIPTRLVDELLTVLTEVKRVNDLANKIEVENMKTLP